jgi:secreted PhoX family phosphatase
MAMEFKKNQLLQALLVAAFATGLAACGADGEDGANGTNGTNGEDGAPGTAGDTGATGDTGEQGLSGTTTTKGLVRIATVPDGAEVTGIFLTEEGDLFFNAQHASTDNTEVDHNNIAYTDGIVGVVEGINFNNLPDSLVDLPVPNSDFERQTVQTAYGQYKILGKTGDEMEGLPFGLGAITTLDGETKLLDNHMPDFNGYVSTGANTGFLFTNWELYPGGMSRLGLEKDAASGEWSVTSAMMVDFSSVNGTGANCFGSVSPWGTPLTSEEWVVQSQVDGTTNATWNSQAEIDGNSLLAGMWALSEEASNPYDFGYIVEITDPAGTPTPVKHFTIGRYEHENSVVMPDGKTVYSSQDDTGGVLFKFVADTAEDLSSGTLYGAKLTQDAGLNDPAVTGFDVSWVELATGDNVTIEAWIDEFDNIGTDDYNADTNPAMLDGVDDARYQGTSYMTVADVEAWAAWVNAGRPATGHTYPTVENGGGKITAGQAMDDRAAFLESRQAARQLGATAEWRKLEGININQKRVEEAVESTDLVADEVVTSAYMYIAIADVDNTMTDGEGDMQLSSRVKDCGGVYRAEINADYSFTRIDPVVMGATYRSSLDGAERCDVNNLSQPDNVMVLDDGRILLGEDGFQENNTLWLYEPQS